MYKKVIIMSFYELTDQAVATEFGRRIEQLRLERNLTQQQIADEVGLSRISYRKLEAGEAKFVNVIAVLRVLGQLPALEHALPEELFSPIEQLKQKGRVRKRARPKASKATENPSSELDW